MDRHTILDLLLIGLVVFACTYFGAVYALFEFTNILIERGIL